MKRRINLQTKVLWITYLILAFTFKDNLICNLLPTFEFFMAKAFMHLFFGMINQEEMREIKNKCSSKDNWIDFSFLLSGVIIFLESHFFLICSFRKELILESSNYLMFYLPNISFSILNLLMAINIHKIKSIRAVGVPEFMKDHQNGDFEFFEKDKCDDCLLEERAKEDEAFENMIEAN